MDGDAGRFNAWFLSTRHGRPTDRRELRRKHTVGENESTSRSFSPRAGLGAVAECLLVIAAKVVDGVR
jgi:hypothetical protein